MQMIPIASYMGPGKNLKIALSSIVILFFHLQLGAPEGFSYQVPQLTRTTNFSLFKLVYPAIGMPPSFITISGRSFKL
jgi:hypothetical protein